MQHEETKHSGMAALVGRANVGKSTLLNALLDEKVSIVSPVAQTTRHVIRGVLTEPRGQVVFLDTPGVHHARSPLGQTMNRAARKAIEGVDVVVLVLDVSTPPRLEDEGWMRRLLFTTTHIAAVLNKTDLGGNEEAYRNLWQRLAEEKSIAKEPDWHALSALKKQGIQTFLDRLFEYMPRGPLLFPEDVLTDFPRRLTLGDIVREQLFRELRDELPHAVAVGVDELDETEDGRWHVRCTIYVDRPSQKGIVIGRKGRLLRKVTARAGEEASRLFQLPVDLKLWVKVEKNWAGNHFLLQRLGLK